jgi:hypothetical protein
MHPRVFFMEASRPWSFFAAVASVDGEAYARNRRTGEGLEASGALVKKTPASSVFFAQFGVWLPCATPERATARQKNSAVIQACRHGVEVLMAWPAASAGTGQRHDMVEAKHLKKAVSFALPRKCDVQDGRAGPTPANCRGGFQRQRPREGGKIFMKRC